MSEAKIQKISGVVTKKGKRWLEISVDGILDRQNNFLLINYVSRNLKEGEPFTLWVQTNKKVENKKTKWFHIPQSDKMNIIVGFGIDSMIAQPIIGNVIVKGDLALLVKAVKRRSNGFDFGYSCEFWWELTCQNISDTKKGRKALSEIID